MNNITKDDWKLFIDNYQWAKWAKYEILAEQKETVLDFNSYIKEELGLRKENVDRALQALDLYIELESATQGIDNKLIQQLPISYFMNIPIDGNSVIPDRQKEIFIETARYSHTLAEFKTRIKDAL